MVDRRDPHRTRTRSRPYPRRVPASRHAPTRCALPGQGRDVPPHVRTAVAAAGPGGPHNVRRRAPTRLGGTDLGVGTLRLDRIALPGSGRMDRPCRIPERGAARRVSRRWEQITRNPVPSLLKSLLEDHLDPGYAAAAADRAAGRASSSPTRTRIWLVIGSILAGLVLGVAYAENTDREPGADQARAEILDSLRTSDERNAALVTRRDELTDIVEQRSAELVAHDAQGAATLDELRVAQTAAAAVPVGGPGITVTLSDPSGRPNLSDPSVLDATGSTATVLDRDLQSVVNALWAGGAEAVSVGDVRIGPGVTIRQAGGAMLVDNQPVFSPYVVSAVGPQAQMQTDFVVSDAYLRLSGVKQLYGVGFTIAEADELELPAATVRTVESARESGNR